MTANLSADSERDYRETMFVMDARRGGVGRRAAKELWAFREVFAAFVIRRIKVRYKQALFGVAWVVIQPVASAAVFAVFLGYLAHFPSEGAPYFLFVLTGLTLWAYFAQALAVAIDSLVAEASVLRKVYFPREIPPLSVVLASLVDLFVAFVVLLVVVVIAGRGVNAFWITLPIPILIVVVLAAGLGLLLSGLNVYYRDVTYGLPFIIQLGFFLSPIIYSATLVPTRYRVVYEVLNPIAGSIQAFRDVLLNGRAPDFAILGMAAAWALGILIFAYAIFKRIERRFADTV